MRTPTPYRMARGLVPRASPARPGFVCAECRTRAARHAPSAPFSSTTQRRDDDPPPDNPYYKPKPNRKHLPRSERIRRMIWGTDSPPGQKDPYALPGQPGSEPNAPEEGKPEPKPAAVERDSYVPATMWEGLERIGGPSGWWEEQWDQEHPFAGWAPLEVTSPEVTKAVIQQTLINLFTLVEEQINTARVMRIPHCAIAYGPVKLGYSEEQGVRIFYPDEGMRDEVINQSKQDLFSLQAAEQKDEPEVEEDVEGAEPPSPESLSIGNGVPGTNSEGEPLKVEETAGHQAPLRVDQVETSTDELVTSEAEAAPRREPVDRRDPMFKNESWLRIPLKGMRLKFFLLKRVTQITGVRLTDPDIARIQTVKDLVDLAMRRPEPKKLADALRLNPELVTLPNVEIMDRRHTPIDKEKEVGRWKIIEQELKRKGLPVTGHY